MSDAKSSIREAQQTPEVQPRTVDRSDVQRFATRQQDHYQHAQQQSGNSKICAAHMHLAEASGHISEAAQHQQAGRTSKVQAALEHAGRAYRAADSAHSGTVAAVGGPVREVLGLAHPAATMAKAEDGASSSSTGYHHPDLPSHLHITLPIGQRVHPESPEGVAHIRDTITGPAKAHGVVLQHHLGQLMEGLDTTVEHRVKTADSLAEKVGRAQKPAHMMNDVLGARITVHNPDHVQEAMRRLRSHAAGTHPMSGQGIQLGGEDDRITHPSSSGYRRVHYNGTAHGTQAEVQLGQPHHTVWADYCHDNFYKDHALKAHLASTGSSHELEAVKSAGAKYAKAVSDHLADTRGRRGPDAPEAPAILKKHGLEFPWHKL